MPRTTDVELFITLCRLIRACNLTDDTGPVWMSLKDDGGQQIAGHFLLGIGTAHGKQITMRIPADRLEDCYFAKELAQAPPDDGHTMEDKITRLKMIL